MEEKKIIPSGEWDYRELAGRCYYVDKTLLIRDLWKNGKKVSLFTRPRRFGKSLNMDTVKTFFEKTDEDTSAYFKDKKIWREESLRGEQGKYPVICMTFASAGQATWEETFYQIKVILSKEYKRHPELETSDRVDGDDLEIFNAIRTRKAEDGDYVGALDTLIRMLSAHYGVPAVVLIDEYDAPIQKGYDKKYYDKAVGFMRDFLGNGLKTNFDMRLAVLTGVTRVSEESIFSGINNLGVYTVLDEDFSEYFGFTREEVQGILDYYDHGDRMDEVLEWYDGYDFGGREIFNPWSVMNYIKKKCTPKAYWVNTSQNLTIRDILLDASYVTTERLIRLLQGEAVSCRVNENVVYGRLKGDADSVFTLLLFSGYLKSVGKDEKNSGDDGDRYFLKIPNKEIRRVFSEEIVSIFRVGDRDDILGAICDAVMKKDAGKLEARLREILLDSSSYEDMPLEGFYHILFLGMCQHLYPTHYIKSNREAGEGMFDLSLEPLRHDPSLRAAIIEVKTVYGDDGKGKKTTVSDEELLSKAGEALFQIDDKKYDAELRERGFTDIIKLGMAFSGDKVKVLFKE